MAYGPFCRLENPETQTKALAVQQKRTGEIWGRPHRQGGLFPCVKAYPRQLLAAEHGIEFVTPTAPDRSYSAPHEARWYYPHTPGVTLHTDEKGEEFAVISVTVTNIQY
jgi:hypothetical protein